MNTGIFRKLRLKIVAISVCILFMLMIAVCSTVYFSMAASIKSNSMEVLDYTAELVLADLIAEDAKTASPDIDESSAAQAAVEPKLPESMDTLLFRNVMVAYLDNTGYIVMVKQGGHVIEHLSLMGSEIPDIERFEDEPQGVIKLQDTDYRYKHITYKGQPILLLLNRSSELANLPRLMNILLVVGFGSIFALIIVCFILTDLAIRPISEAWNTQQQFLHDASHELKTPLAVIATNLDAARSSPNETVASQEKWLRYASDEVNDMRQLVNDMLALALNNHPNADIRNQPFTPFCLSDTVTEVGLIMEANALEAGIELKLDIEDDLWVVGYRDGIKRVVLILLDNALKNTFAGGTITLELHRYRNDLYVSCTNTGHGIPREELKNIFKRFYRLDSSRARMSGGTGLGLPIAEGVITKHGGKIWAESELEKYARFTFKLPAASNKHE